MLPPSLGSPFYFLLWFCPDIHGDCFRQLDAFPLVFPSYFLLVGTEILQVWPELVDPCPHTIAEVRINASLHSTAACETYTAGRSL